MSLRMEDQINGLHRGKQMWATSQAVPWHCLTGWCSRTVGPSALTVFP